MSSRQGWHSTELAKAPRGHGCYAFFGDGNLVYIGVSVNVFVRLQSWYGTFHHTGTQIATRWGTYESVTLRVRECPSRHEARWREGRLIHRLTPSGNSLIPHERRSLPPRLVTLDPTLGFTARGVRAIIAEQIALAGSQHAFAELVGASHTYVNAIVKGKRPPTSHRILHALGLQYEKRYVKIEDSEAFDAAECFDLKGGPDVRPA